MSQEEEAALVAEADAWLRKLAYQGGHFDGVITGYREVQKAPRAFSPRSRSVLRRITDAVFAAEAPGGPAPRLLPVHVLDLEPAGYISRHVDHVEYSGEYIVGLSLLSHATMILHRDGEREAERGGRGGERGAAATSGHDSAPRSGSADESAWLPLQLPRRSLYVLRGEARYGWAHSVPLEHEGVPAESPRKGRRLAFIWRDAPPD